MSVSCYIMCQRNSLISLLEKHVFRLLQNSYKGLFLYFVTVFLIYRCVPGLHPRLRWSRSVRAKRALLMAQNQRQQVWQRDGRRRNKKGRKTKKRGGKGKGNMCSILRYVYISYIGNKSSSTQHLTAASLHSLVAHMLQGVGCCVST